MGKRWGGPLGSTSKRGDELLLNSNQRPQGAEKAESRCGEKNKWPGGKLLKRGKGWGENLAKPPGRSKSSKKKKGRIRQTRENTEKRLDTTDISCDVRRPKTSKGTCPDENYSNKRKDGERPTRPSLKKPKSVNFRLMVHNQEQGKKKKVTQKTNNGGGGRG